MFLCFNLCISVCFVFQTPYTSMKLLSSSVLIFKFHPLTFINDTYHVTRRTRDSVTVPPIALSPTIHQNTTGSKKKVGSFAGPLAARCTGVRYLHRIVVQVACADFSHISQAQVAECGIIAVMHCCAFMTPSAQTRFSFFDYVHRLCLDSVHAP